MLGLLSACIDKLGGASLLLVSKLLPSRTPVELPIVRELGLAPTVFDESCFGGGFARVSRDFVLDLNVIGVDAGVFAFNNRGLAAVVVELAFCEVEERERSDPFDEDD